MSVAPSIPPGVIERIRSLGDQIETLTQSQHDLAQIAGISDEDPGRFGILHGYLGVLAVSFVVTMLATPIVRRLAIANGVVDQPSDPRKQHSIPIAYLGGVAIFFGLMAGILFSYFAIRFDGLIDFHATQHLADGFRPHPVPFWIVGGLAIIMLAGLLDDIYEMSPRVKLGMQLMAAAGLAWGNIGTNLAQGVLSPTIGSWIGNEDLVFTLFKIPHELPLTDWLTGGTGMVTFDLIYWSGAVAIAIFVLGATNAANFIDGLDGLLTGTTAIASVGFLVIALALAVADDGPLDSARIVLSLAVLGACLGFLPYNFSPATIFLGDCGSLLLGYSCAVLILSLGDTGKTYLVLAGVIIYGIPITDTALAIVRRKLAGKSITTPDANHLHHMLMRTLGVKGAVFTLYGIAAACATLGILITETRARVIYALTFLFFSYIGVYAIKVARRTQLEEQSAHLHTLPPPKPEPEPDHADSEPAPGL